MKTNQITISYEEYESAEQLSAADRQLLELARRATADAYAPYSGFQVGAAARLMNGEMIKGSNQENASFPAGICAERVLTSSVSSMFPGVTIEVMAVSYHQDGRVTDSPVAPCGICRQTLQELESRSGRPIRLILGGMSGRVIILPGTSALLPFAFSGADMK